MLETAYAKINLALHVRSRREDGYHMLETAFAFVDAGDTLSVAPADQDSLRVVGEYGGELLDPFGNIVAKALNCLPGPSPGRSRWKSGCRWRRGWAAVRRCGRGVPSGRAASGPARRLARARRRAGRRCARLRRKPRLHRAGHRDRTGTGGRRSGRNPVLLVNPRIPLPTGPVFKGWDGIDRGPMPEGTTRTIALEGRNDLEAPARAGAADRRCSGRLARNRGLAGAHVGLGATCFALYDTLAARDAALAAMPASWWTLAGKLR
jgi:4-diphosphocytidyl-2-C-methyl-D-erythritol kinase